MIQALKFRIGHINGIPANRGNLVVINGRELALFRTSEDDIYVYENVLSNGEGPLVHAVIERDKLIAPESGYRFDLHTGDGVGNRHFINTFPVWIENGEIYIQYPTLIVGTRHVQSMLN